MIILHEKLRYEKQMYIFTVSPNCTKAIKEHIKTTFLKIWPLSLKEGLSLNFGNTFISKNKLIHFRISSSKINAYPKNLPLQLVLLLQGSCQEQSLCHLVWQTKRARE